MDEHTDEELIDQFLAGDEEAFSILLNRYLSPVYTFCLRLLGNQYDAEDATQDTFLKAWKHIRNYHPEHARFRTWLFHIARNTAYDSLRKKRFATFSQFDDGEGGNAIVDTLLDTEPLPDEDFAMAQNAEQLAESLEKLPVRSREVLILRYNEGLSFDEIHEVLDEPLNTVKSRHRRALMALKKVIEEDPRQRGLQERIV